MFLKGGVIVDETQLRKECGLKPGELINTNLGLIDILGVKDGMVTLGKLAGGEPFTESVESVIAKLKGV